MSTYTAQRFEADRLLSAINYDASLIVAKEGGKIMSKQELAPECEVGTRLKSYRVIRHAEELSIQYVPSLIDGASERISCLSIGDLLKSDGRFRVLLFAGKAAKPEQMKRVEQFAACLSFIPLYTKSSRAS